MRRILSTVLVATAMTALACTSQPTPTPTPAATPPAKPAASPAAAPAASPAVQASPSPIAVRGTVAVTANEADGSLSVVDIGAGRVASTIAVDRPPHRIDMTNDARLAAASDNSPNSHEVVLVDISAARKLADLSVGAQPDGVAMLNRGAELVVANSGEDSVSDIDLNARTVSGTVRVGNRPRGVTVAVPAAAPGAPAPAPAVSPVVSPSPAVSPAAVSSPRPATQAPPRAFVANEGAGSVSVIDLATRQVSSTVQVGGRPTRLAVAPDGSRVFVLNEGTDSVVVLDVSSSQRVTEIPVGPSLTDLAATADGAFLFVTATDPARNLYKVDLAEGRVVQTSSVLRAGGVLPSASPAAAPSPAVSPAASPAASPSPGTAGPGTLAVAAGPAAGRVYVTTTEDQLVVWDVDANRATGSVGVGRRPVDLAVGVAGTTPGPAPSPAVPPSPSVAPAPAGSPSPARPGG